MISRASLTSMDVVNRWPPYEPGRQPSAGSFSVVVPAYNGAQFIAKAIWSIQTQYLPVAEIHVIDDASNDETVAIVRELAQTDQRIKLIQNEFNRGPSYSRNVGIRQARGDYVAFLDADDQWLPDHLENLAEAFEALPSAAVAYAHTCDSESRADTMQNTQPPQLLVTPFLEFLIDNPVPQSGVAVRRSALLAMGGYREELRHAEDYELWMRFVLANASFAHVSRSTVLRLEHPDQVSVRDSQQMFRAAWQVRSAAVKEHYGQTASVDAAGVVSLLASEALYISAALTRRRRDLLETTIEATEWIPASAGRLDAVRRLLGWKWHIWRTLALTYDSLPSRVRLLIRSRRRATMETGGAPL